jgi:nucleoside-diphosphate-sugar epimerase
MLFSQAKRYSYRPQIDFCSLDSDATPPCRLFYLGTDFVIWGSGAPLRQFIFSNDLAALTVAVMRRWDSVEPIILSVGEDAEVSIGDVARLVAGLHMYTSHISAS